MARPLASERSLISSSIPACRSPAIRARDSPAFAACLDFLDNALKYTNTPASVEVSLGVTELRLFSPLSDNALVLRKLICPASLTVSTAPIPPKPGGGQRPGSGDRQVDRRIASRRVDGRKREHMARHIPSCIPAGRFTFRWSKGSCIRPDGLVRAKP